MYSNEYGILYFSELEEKYLAKFQFIGLQLTIKFTNFATSNKKIIRLWTRDLYM